MVFFGNMQVYPLVTINAFIIEARFLGDSALKPNHNSIHLTVEGFAGALTDRNRRENENLTLAATALS